MQYLAKRIRSVKRTYRCLVLSDRFISGLNGLGRHEPEPDASDKFGELADIGPYVLNVFKIGHSAHLLVGHVTSSPLRRCRGVQGPT